MAPSYSDSQATTDRPSRKAHPLDDFADQLVIIQTIDGRSHVGELVGAQDRDWLTVKRFVRPYEIVISRAAVASVEAVEQ